MKVTTLDLPNDQTLADEFLCDGLECRTVVFNLGSVDQQGSLSRLIFKPEINDNKREKIL